MTTYLITGASRGLGHEFVRQLRARGETVIAAVRGASGASPELLALGADVVQLDVGDADSIGSLSARLGGRAIDVLINNAGVSSEAKSVQTLTASELHRVFMVNAFAPILMTRSLLPNLRAGSSRIIVNVTSILGSIGANMAGGFSYPYCASKTALNMLTFQLAHELRPERFTCVAIHPGWVKTDMGGPEAPLDPKESIAGMLGVINSLSPDLSGRYLNYDGASIQW